MKKAVLIIGTIVIVLTAGFFALNNYIYNEKQGDGPAAVVSYRGTLTGEYVCLPKEVTGGQTTQECALGIKTDSGKYYALDFGMMSQPKPQLATGDRFKATGLITPLAMLSSFEWQKYTIEGIFSVTDSVQKL